MNTPTYFNTPEFEYYALMKLEEGPKTPKYTITNEVGCYPPMWELVSPKTGKVSMYLMPSIGDNPDAPEMRLQARGSLNLSGLKQYYEDGKLSGYAYGNPFDKPTYGKDKKVNPFFVHKKDAFLFIMHQSQEGTINIIEFIALKGLGSFAKQYCSMLAKGGFNDRLEEARKLANVHFI